MTTTRAGTTDVPRVRRYHGPGLVMRLLQLLATAALVAVALLALLIWRLTQGPLDLPDWTVAQVETRLSGDLAPRSLSLGAVALAYDVEARALRLQLRETGLLESDGNEILHLPDIRVALDVLALLEGRVRPSKVEVRGLDLEVARDAEGRLIFAFGQGGGALPASWREALETFDTILATPAIADLAEVEVTGVAVRLQDAITGLDDTVREGRATWRRLGTGGALELGAVLGLGGTRTDVEATVSRSDRGQGVQAALSVDRLSLPGLAAELPRVPALTLVRGLVSATASMTLSEDGVPGELRGELRLSDVSMTDRPAMALDRAVLGFGWVPGSGRIAFEEFAAASDAFSTEATGQLLLEDGFFGPLALQLRLGPTVVDPEERFDQRIAFDGGVFEARLTEDPLAIRIGQAVVTGPLLTARIAGDVAFRETGPQGALRLSVPRVDVAGLRRLWPQDLQEQARRWFVTNLTAGTATDLTALLRLEPGQPPDAVASFGFEDGTFRFMREMPPAEKAEGVAQLVGDRFTVRVDGGAIPAIGPDATTPSGEIDVAGTVFSIPDTRQKPPDGELSLLARGEIGDIMEVLDNPPFRVLSRLGRDRERALVARHYDSPARRFVDALAETGVERAVAASAYGFALGALIGSVGRDGRVRRLGGPDDGPDETEALIERLVSFAAGGLHALAERGPTSTSRPRAAKRGRTRRSPGKSS